MKKKLARFLMTFVLVLCLGFGLTACKKNDDDDTPAATAKVTSISVGLAEGLSYTLTDGKITIEYSEDINFTGSDFVVTATMSDSTTKTLSLKSDSNPNGYTFKSTIPSDNLTTGDYTLTFGHADLAENAYKTITVKVVAANVNLSALGLTMTTGLKYNGQEQTATVTNLPLYLTASYSGNTGKYPNGTTPPAESGETPSAIPDTYTATVTFAVKNEYENKYILSSEHNTIDLEWTIAKGTIEMPNTDDIMVNYEYDSEETRTAAIVDSKKNELNGKNIHAEITGATSGTNANTYQVAILFTYTGTDKAYYDFGDKGDGVIGSVDTSWLINPKSIDVSSVALKVKGGDAYSSETPFTYSATEKEVEFDLSSINTYITGDNPILSQTSSNMTATNAGDYTATITFTVNNTNYAVSGASISKPWKINKANFGVFAEPSQKFAYGTTLETISTTAKLASETYYSDAFATAESSENKTALYKTLKTAITSYEVRLDSGLNTTAYTGKLNAGEYYLYPIIPSDLQGFENYDINPNGTSFTITQKELDVSINEKTVEYSRNIIYDKSDLEINSNDLVYGDTINDIEITIYSIEYKLTSETSTTWGDASKVGTYAVKINSISSNNYDINITNNESGVLNIVPLPVDVQESDVSWNINNDNSIVPTYNKETGEWEATIETTGNLITYEIVIEENDTIFSRTYTDKNGETLSEIKEAGTYYIKAKLSLPSDETRYSYDGDSFVLKLTITENYFETSTAAGGGTEGEPQKTISVIVKTTEEDAETGATQETSEDLTFNEFASKTEFKEGDTVKFTLKGDPAATSSSNPSEEGEEDKEEDEEEGEGYSASPTSQVVLYAATRTFARYIVLYNGQEVSYNVTEKCYIIHIERFNGSAEDKGLKIIRVYTITSEEEGEPTEYNETIFAKTNINVPNNDDNDHKNDNPSVDFEIPASFKVGNKTFYTDGSVSTEQFYKLSETQETLTFTFSEDWLDRNLYLVFGSQRYIEINATTLTIDMTPYLDSSVGLDFAWYNSEENRYCEKGLTNAHIYPWSVIETIKLSYKGVESDGMTDRSVVLDTGHRGNVEVGEGVTGITLTFESGYGNYTYKITAFDHETVLYDSSDNASKLDLTKLNHYSINRIWFIIYDADGNEVGSVGYDFKLDESENEIPNNNVEVSAEITSVDKWKYPSVKADGDGNTTFNLTCSTENLSIYTFNNSGAYSFVLKDADGEEVFSEIAEEDNGELDGITAFDYRFFEAGTYTLTMTAIDRTTTRTFTIVVTGEYVPTLDVSFDTDGDGEDKTLHCELIDLNDLELTENSDFKMAIDYVNLTYSLDAYVGENHGLKITSKNGKKYVKLNSFETIYKDLYDLKKNKLTCPAELEVLTNSKDVEYVSFKLKITRSIWIVVNVYFGEPSSDLEITLTGKESKNDKKLTCNITDREAMTTEGDFEMTMADVEGYDIACMVACVGDIETLGTKVTTTDSVSHISFTGLSSGLFLMMADDNGDMIRNDSGDLLLHEVSDIKFVKFYGMTANDQMMAIMICFCDKNDLPEGFIEANVMSSTDTEGDGDNDGDQENKGDGSGTQENSTVNIMKVTMATTNDEYIILVYNKNDKGYGVEEYNNVESGEASIESETGVIAFSFDYVVSSSEYNKLMSAETYNLNGLEFLNQYASDTWTLKTDEDGGTQNISSTNSNLSLKVTKNYKYDKTNGNPCLSFVLASSTGMKIICNITFIISSGSVVE